MSRIFDHEKLKVYQTSIEFLIWVHGIIEKIPKKYAVHNQLDRASTSIPLNIAEGNGKFTNKDRCKYFDIARGSIFECAAALDVIVAKKIINKNKIKEGKELLLITVSLLVGLIKNNSNNRVCETQEKYQSDDIFSS